MEPLVISIPHEAPPERVRLVYEVVVRHEPLPREEDDMPETPLHDQILSLLQDIFRAWLGSNGRSVMVARHLACRWSPDDARAGMVPDLCLVEPVPADVTTLTELRLWEPGQAPPWLGVEVVSEATGVRDYHDAPARYARLGVRELWVFDPRRVGPATTGGPFVLQVWRREGSEMHRVYAGNGPAFSLELKAWLQVVHSGRHLRLSHDEGGKRLWMNEVEVAMQALQQAMQRGELERIAREQAETSQRTERSAREQTEVLHRTERSAREQAETAERTAQTAREHAEAAQRAERLSREQCEVACRAERAVREQAETAQRLAQLAREQTDALYRAERSAREQAEQEVTELRGRLAELEPRPMET